MKYINHLTELIGETPLLRLNQMGIPEGFQVFAKLEFCNPGGECERPDRNADFTGCGRGRVDWCGDGAHRADRW